MLREYVSFSGTGITGPYIPPAKLGAVARAYGVSYARANVPGTSDYFINHTPATYAVDRQGRLRLAYDYTQLVKVGKVIGDLRSILGERP